MNQGGFAKEISFKNMFFFSESGTSNPLVTKPLRFQDAHKTVVANCPISRNQATTPSRNLPCTSCDGIIIIRVPIRGLVQLHFNEEFHGQAVIDRIIAALEKKCIEMPFDIIRSSVRG